MQEATLFILKQVLDEFRTYDKIVDSEAAAIFLDHIRASMHDRKPRSNLFLLLFHCALLNYNSRG